MPIKMPLHIAAKILAARQKKNAAEALEKSQRKTLTPEQIRANVKHKEEVRRKQEALQEQQRLASHKAREKRLKEAAQRKALAKRDRKRCPVNRPYSLFPVRPRNRSRTTR